MSDPLVQTRGTSHDVSIVQDPAASLSFTRNHLLSYVRVGSGKLHVLQFVSSRVPGSPRGRGFERLLFYRFREELGRGTDFGLKEYMRRASIFQASLSEILAVNQRNRQQGRAWTAGPHPFMDWTASERSSLHGYRPGKTPLSVLQVGRDCGDSLSFEFDDHWRQVRRGSACSQSRLTHVTVHGVVAVDVKRDTCLEDVPTCLTTTATS